MTDHCRSVELEIIEEREEIGGVIGKREAHSRFVRKTMPAEIDRKQGPSYEISLISVQQRQPGTPRSPDSMEEEYRFACACSLDSMERQAGLDLKAVMDQSVRLGKLHRCTTSPGRRSGRNYT